MLKQLFFLISFNFFVSSVLSQSVRFRDSVPLTPEFQFKDGIFLSFKQVKNNNPVPRSLIITNLNKLDLNFYNKLLSASRITILYNGKIVSVPVSKIWGYSDGGSLYIHWKDDFGKITNKGWLAHFASVVIEKTYADNPQYWYYDQYYFDTRTSEQLKQFILDFKTGKVYPFTPKSLLKLFFTYDLDLYMEYKKLPPRKQKKLLFYYIRKFNQKHKIYIKTNKS